jgi:hypothetical protein
MAMENSYETTLYDSSRIRVLFSDGLCCRSLPGPDRDCENRVAHGIEPDPVLERSEPKSGGLLCHVSFGEGILLVRVEALGMSFSIGDTPLPDGWEKAEIPIVCRNIFR